jgi:methionyl-tRNA formyltransferase
VRIAFLGTPDVAVPSLTALLDATDIDVEVVVTNPDRPRGRRATPMPPPVKQAALAAGVPVWQPAHPSEVVQPLADLGLDAGAVVAYGALLPPALLASTRLGFVNLHFSLLPRWRGAAPVQHALRAGDRRTGVTTFVIDEGMDTGPIVAQQAVDIGPEEYAGDLLGRLATLGADVLVDSLRALDAGTPPEPQPHDGITLAPKIRPGDLVIDFGAPARAVVDLIRSAAPAPGARTTLRGASLKVFEGEVDAVSGGEPGEIVRVDRDGPVVACGRGAVRLRAVQPAGRRRMTGAALVNGHRLREGERLGDPAA